MTFKEIFDKLASRLNVPGSYSSEDRESAIQLYTLLMLGQMDMVEAHMEVLKGGDCGKICAIWGAPLAVIQFVGAEVNATVLEKIERHFYIGEGKKDADVCKILATYGEAMASALQCHSDYVSSEMKLENIWTWVAMVFEMMGMSGVNLENLVESYEKAK